MDKLTQFLLKVGVTQAKINDILAEGSDIASIATEYNSDQLSIAKAKIKDEITTQVKEEINAAALITVQESVKTKLKRELGLSIPNIKAVPFEEFIQKATEELKESVKGQTDEESKKKIKEVTEKYTSALDEIETLKVNVTKAEKAAEEKIKDYEYKDEAKKQLGRVFTAITWGGTPGQVSFFKENVEKEVLSDFVLEGEKIWNKDKTPVVLEGNVVLKTVDDFINHKANKSEMIKKNGAHGSEPGGGGNGGSTTIVTKSDGTPVNPNAEKAAAKAAEYLKGMEQ